jgi:hypothetical protein
VPIFTPRDRNTANVDHVSEKCYRIGVGFVIINVYLAVENLGINIVSIP